MFWNWRCISKGTLKISSGGNARKNLRLICLEVEMRASHVPLKNLDVKMQHVRYKRDIKRLKSNKGGFSDIFKN